MSRSRAEDWIPQTRHRRQRAAAMVSTSSFCTVEEGWNSSTRDAWSWRKRLTDSVSRTTVCASRPWRALLREELSLPGWVLGPLERAPLAREVWICFSLGMVLHDTRWCLAEVAGMR